MIPTIWYQLDFPCTRQAQEALSRVRHVEDREQGRHSDRRSTTINAFRPTTELRRTFIPHPHHLADSIRLSLPILMTHARLGPYCLCLAR
jgi:hypothetical protein